MEEFTNSRIGYLQQLYFDSLNLAKLLSKEIRLFIESREYISENAKDLANMYERITNIILTQLETEYALTFIRMIAWQKEPTLINRDKNIKSPEEGLEILEKDLYNLFIVLRKLTPIIKYIIGARIEINKWGVISQIDRLCRSLNSNARILVSPRWEYMYSYVAIMQKLNDISEDAEKYNSKLGYAIKECIFPSKLEGSPIFSSLAYPPVSSDNILHLAIWGHEIGHFNDNLEGIKYERILGNLPKIASYQSICISRKYEIDIKKIFEKELDEINLTEITDLTLKWKEKWVTEIFSDLFSVKLFGPAAIFSLIDFSKPRGLWIDYTGPMHVSIRKRIGIMLEALKKWFNIESIKALPARAVPYYELFKSDIAYLELIANEVNKPVFIDNEGLNSNFELLFPKFMVKIEEIINELFTSIDKFAKENPDCFLQQEDFTQIFQGVIDLENKIPPEYYYDDDKARNLTIPLVVNSGWLYWNYFLRQTPFTISNLIRENNSLQEFKEINKLLLKSIENTETQNWFKACFSYGRKNDNQDANNEQHIEFIKQETGDKKVHDKEVNNDSSGHWTGGILSGSSIKRIINSETSENLIVRPLLDKSTQIGSCSLDIRLGNSFMLTKYPFLLQIDPIGPDFNSDLSQNVMHLPFGKPFILHPNQLVLSISMEFFAVPNNIMGLVQDRESWGRLGLVMTTRFKLIPGYKGCISLSFTNVGNVPIPLYPGSRVGQILFYSVL